jgi:phage terminase large subunit-like protein
MRPGPKAQLSAAELDLRRLPKAGGARVIAFIERFVRLPKGKGARQPMKLRPWQKEIIRGLFDRPRPRQALVSLSRGNGKTTLAAAIALYGLLGDGVEGAQVLCVASDERQAGIVFNLARRMVELEPRLSDRVQIFQDKLYVPTTDSMLRTLPAEPGSLLGYDPSLCVVDELGVVTRATWEAISLTAGKRPRSLTLAISTPAANSDSIMWELVQVGRGGEDRGFYFVEYAAPADCEVTDEDAWYVANPALGDFLHLDGMRATLRTSRESSFRRFRLGQWVEGDGEGLPAGAWEECAIPGPIPEGEKVALGVYGSFTQDSAAIVAVSAGERPHIDLVRLWEAPEGAHDFVVPILDIEEEIRQACGRWKVPLVMFNSSRWARSMQLLAEQGLTIANFTQSNAVETRATESFYEGVMNRQLSHSGNPELARHVGNGVLKIDARGARFTKETRHARRYVDALIATVIAYFAVFNLPSPPVERVPLIGFGDPIDLSGGAVMGWPFPMPRGEDESALVR